MIIAENIITQTQKGRNPRVSNRGIQAKMQKNELRKLFLAKQKSLSSDERSEKSTKICNNFFKAFDLSKISFLHCFLPIKKFNEIDTSIIITEIWQRFPTIETVVPQVNFQNLELQSLIYKADTELTENSWNIFEPMHDKFIKPVQIDMVLVPLLCVDKKGLRVGYGKGFYDRFLKDCRPDCLKIGLSYFEPIDEISDVNEFDVKLDFCVYPENIVKF